MKSKLCLFSITLIFMIAHSLFAQGLLKNIRNQEFIGARPMAMGETFVAVADDINAIYWNPAGLPTLNHLGVNSMHANLFQSGVGLNYLSVSIPGPHRISIGVDWLNIGFNDEELEFGKNKFNFSAGYQLVDNLAFGMNLKYIQMSSALDHISQGSFKGWGFDWGLLYQPWHKLKLGLVVHDFTNTKLNGIKEPVYRRNLRIGAAYQLFDNWIIATDVDDRLHLGSEWLPIKKLFALRGGLQKDFYTDEPLTFSFGFGLDIPIWGQRLRFDYAFTDTPTLLNTHRSSLSILIDLFPRLVKIKNVEIKPVYASLYKYYEDNSIGKVDVEYKGKKNLDCTISVTVNKYGSENKKNIVLPVRPVQEQMQQVNIFPAFNDSILNEQDNIPLMADIKISYLSGNRPKEETVSQKFTLYRRNQIDWQHGADQAAAFITPEDPVVVQFTRKALSNKNLIKPDLIINEEITKAALLFNSISKSGIQYDEDPYSPYRLTYHSIDNILYPAQLLTEKRGDCDDLCVLVASLLENRNIATVLVSVPKHILLLFDSGIHPSRSFLLCCADDQYFHYQNQLWIPLETTWINHSFYDAWKEGAKQFNQYSDDREIINVREAWQKYQPIAHAGQFIKSFNFTPNLNLAQESDSIKIIQKKYLSELENRLAQSPDSSQLRNKLAITYAHRNNFEKARYHFQQLLLTDSANFFALNNLGNLFFMEGNLDSAQLYYLKALDYAKDKDGIYLNLGLVYAAANLDSEAVDMFTQVMQDSTDYQKISDLLGIKIQKDDLIKSAKLEMKKKVSSTTVIKITDKARKKQKPTKKKESKKTLGDKGSLPKNEIENVFYWAF